MSRAHCMDVIAALGQILNLSVLHTCKMGIITILACTVVTLKKRYGPKILSLEITNPQSMLAVIIVIIIII